MFLPTRIFLGTAFCLLTLCAVKAQTVAPFPLAETVSTVKSSLADYPVTATGLQRSNYLETISGIVNFFHHHQDVDGRIIDPFVQKEYQYATPCYAWAAAALVKNGKQTNLLPSAALALECAVKQLAENKPAMRHGDFFTFPAMLAYENLRDLVSAEQRQRIEGYLRQMNPADCYSDVLKRGDGEIHNWNIVALSGEFLRFQNGFTDLNFVESYLPLQLPYFTSYGMYRDPHLPMAYDHFPRHFLAALLERSYKGNHQAELEQILDRGAWTSLLMQSPTGELPTGGRSAQHQWNEAEQCVTYEIWANRSRRAGDDLSARAFKRAAHLALQSIQRWVRPSGELFIVKNHFDPAARHGFEKYSSHSQYNLLAASMMATAWMFADDSISEGASPADRGGFAFEIPEFNKVFANAGGLYLEIDTGANPDYNSTGLLRVHKRGVDSLVGPSDGAPAKETPLAIGVSWLETNRWQSLAGLPLAKIKKVQFQRLTSKTNTVKFSVVYQVEGSAVKTITEAYELDGNEVKVAATVTGDTSRTKVTFPALTFDGHDAATIAITNAKASITLRDSRECFTVESRLEGKTLRRTGQFVSSRNGFLEAIEGVVRGKSVQFRLRPERLTEKSAK